MEQLFQSLSAEDLAQIAVLAKDLHNSKLCPPALDSKEKVQTIILLGRELGIPTMAAVRGIQIVQGVPVITPALMLALAFRSKDLVDYEIVTSNDLGAAVRIQRRGYPPRCEFFTMEDAERFGFAEQAAWIEQPRAMCRWQAIAQALRFDFADLFFGLFLPHEIDGANSDAQGTAYAQAADIHAESPWRPSKAILAARAISAATRPSPPALAAAPAPQDEAPAPVQDTPAPARVASLEDLGEARAVEAPAGASKPPCPPGGHVFLGFPRCAVCHVQREVADAQLPVAPLQPEALPAPLATPATARLAAALADASTEAARPRAGVPLKLAPPAKCWACGDVGTIPIDAADPSQGETDCLLCRAQAIQPESAPPPALAALPDPAPTVAPQAETSSDGQPAQAAAIPAAQSAAGGKLFATEGIGELQMQILETATKVLPPGANLRDAFSKWVLRRYEIAGGLPGLVATFEQQGKDAHAELIIIRDLFQAEHEKRVKAAVAEAVQEDPRGK